LAGSPVYEPAPLAASECAGLNPAICGGAAEGRCDSGCQADAVDFNQTFYHTQTSIHGEV